MNTCPNCRFNPGGFGLCYQGGRQKRVASDETCEHFEQRCEKCEKYAALIQEYLEYRPFTPSYMSVWLQKLVNVHLERN